MLAGVAFGVLHNNGGRNWSFAAWASVVGVLYGAAFLITEVRAWILGSSTARFKVEGMQHVNNETRHAAIQD